MAARESCSSSGSREACSRICFRSFVMAGLYHGEEPASANCVRPRPRHARATAINCSRGLWR
jgi:hypothetical protein